MPPTHPLVSSESQRWADRAYNHVRALAVDIGPRPSTYEGERRAAEYALTVLTRAGLAYPHLENFTSGRSTYRPYTWAFIAGLLGHALAGLGPLPNPLLRGEGGGSFPSSGRASMMGLAAALNALGAWAFFREATLRDHWGRHLSPSGPSQNVVGLVKPRGEVRQRVVLFGHLDTHRTPVFYSSARWLWIFGQSLTGALVSLVGSALLYSLLAVRPNPPAPFPARAEGEEMGVDGHPFLGEGSSLRLLHALRLPLIAFQSWALGMLVHADRTPYTPGANDNASGAATVLAVAERLAQSPLDHTEVWVVNTGCEELGAYGSAAFLDRHGDELRDALFINFDQLGVGEPTLNLSEGLVYPIHYTPELLQMAREVAVGPNPPPPFPTREGGEEAGEKTPPLPGEGPGARSSLLGPEHPGGAYTDTWHVITRGFKGIILDARPAEGDLVSGAHWHQMSDTFDKVDLAALARAHEWAWRLLQRIDHSPSPSAH
ncbi:MAG: M20/M25/M40 family metallo-hydrolase [Anaerolineae bacterium]|nr:M20/M25/M40 family metallo-hydrolase [Anaerolineae bacterium]